MEHVHCISLSAFIGLLVLASVFGYTLCNAVHYYDAWVKYKRGQGPSPRA